MSREQGAIDRMWRRILMVIGRGRLSAPANDAGPIQTLQVKLGPLETMDNLKRMPEFGFTSNPPEGSEVVAVFICGNRDNGVVVASNHQASRPRGLTPGETMLFDLWGKQIYLSENGIVIDAKSTPVTVNNATTVTVNAADAVIFNAPEVEVKNTLRVGNGASGSFTTPTGQTVTVRDGIITNIY